RSYGRWSRLRQWSWLLRGLGASARRRLGRRGHFLGLRVQQEAETVGTAGRSIHPVGELLRVGHVSRRHTSREAHQHDSQTLFKAENMSGLKYAVANRRLAR